MKYKSLGLPILGLAGFAVYAQIGAPPGPPGYRGPRGLEFRMQPWKVVTGAPYSADVNNVVTETLSDGNTIQRSTKGRVARDRQGRTYLQETITGGPLAQSGPKTITFISDPVAGYSYVLNPNTKIATRRATKTAGEGYPPHSGNKHGLADSANVVETDLGTQIVNGVTAQGTSITRTIPAGAIGNAQPIISKSETWYSPDLQIVVMAKRSDPRMGQMTYTLNNIQRTDPNPALFQVPSDYKIEDAPAWRGRHGVEAPPPPPS